MFNLVKILLLSMLLINSVYAENSLKPAVTTPIPINQIKDYSLYPATIKKLIHEAWNLSRKNLTYQFGSASPNNEGMDCSGAIFYLLTTLNVPDVPRDSKGMYEWVKKSGHFHKVYNQDFSSSEFSALKPGDLLFWTGTYANQHPDAISHVMLYLGKTLQNKPIMFGSSDGRSYAGNKMWGVSVFDFLLPNDISTAKFIGYSCIPTLTCEKTVSHHR